ncbi:WD40 repeat domain-containing protein [Streptomyces syringium]|uniref:WD40 repeat domain-containing protein n=1 Tax=Streptomyces syringium TaxID=76729 RepID=UPI0033EA851B
MADTPDRVTGPAAGGQILRLRLDGRLDGRFDEATAQLAEGYGRVRSGRLVVLGEPGAGKTVLAILLALGLLKTRTPGGPVPVLLAASSWDPVCEPLDDWIVHTLASSYYSGRRDIPRRLLDRGLLLPILDGLDEIPESSRRSAIHAINRALGGDRPIVVTCRSAEYEDVIEGGAPVLRRAPVVQVAPVAVGPVDAGPRIGSAETGIGAFALWALSPEGRYLATAATDGTVSLWDREAGETVGHTRISAPVVAIEAGRTGTVVAVERVEEGTDTTTRTCHVLRQGAHLVRKLELYGWELSGDGKTLAAEGDDAIDVLDTATGELLARLPASVGLLALNRDGSMIAAAGDGDTVELWDTRGGGHRTATLVGHLSSVASAAFSDDGKYLATHSEDGTVRVWNAREGVA